MIFSSTPKTIRVMFTPFRDGLQSSFGGKVRLNDFLPAMQASAAAGIRHFEFGGGARFQAPLFYLGEDPFEDMETPARGGRSGGRPSDPHAFRFGRDADDAVHRRARAAGAADARSRHDVGPELRLHERRPEPGEDRAAHRRRRHAPPGVRSRSWDSRSSRTRSTRRRSTSTSAGSLLESDVRIDSLCLKDASGTTDPNTIYETRGRAQEASCRPRCRSGCTRTTRRARRWPVTWRPSRAGPTASIVSVRPLASGTVQPDVRSLAHAPQGHGVHARHRRRQAIGDREHARRGADGLRLQPDDDDRRRARAGLPDAGRRDRPQRPHDGEGRDPREVRRGAGRVPGGGGGRRRVDQRDAGKPAVLAPGLQQRAVRALEEDRSRLRQAVLGYFGKTPLPPDPEVVKIASEQLDLPVFDGRSARGRAEEHRAGASRRWRSAVFRRPTRTSSWSCPRWCPARRWSSTRASGC